MFDFVSHDQADQENFNDFLSNYEKLFGRNSVYQNQYILIHYPNSIETIPISNNEDVNDLIDEVSEFCIEIQSVEIFLFYFTLLKEQHVFVNLKYKQRLHLVLLYHPTSNFVVILLIISKSYVFVAKIEQVPFFN
jgi:hypothetical protein